jgi:hypothetical protein
MARSDGPPVEYLRECSSTSLRYFEMSKLEHVANLRRELAVLLDEMMEESALALFARWMLERRSSPAAAPGGAAHGAKGGAARKVRSLLADFLAASSSPQAAEAPGRKLLEEFECRAGSEDDAEEPVPGAKTVPSPKPHGSPQRGAPRVERRKTPRSPRAETSSTGGAA